LPSVVLAFEGLNSGCGLEITGEGLKISADEAGAPDKTESRQQPAAKERMITLPSRTRAEPVTKSFLDPALDIPPPGHDPSEAKHTSALPGNRSESTSGTPTPLFDHLDCWDKELESFELTAASDETGLTC